MVSPDPQMTVVAPGAEPESTQVQRIEDGGTIIRIFWVGPKGELLRRTPVSSAIQVGFERRFPPCSSRPWHTGAARAGPMPGPDSGLARLALSTFRTWRPPRLLPGSRAAPGGARAPAAARGAAPARAGGGCAPRPRPETPHFPSRSPAGLGDPPPGPAHTGHRRRLAPRWGAGIRPSLGHVTPPTLVVPGPPCAVSGLWHPGTSDRAPKHFRIVILDVFRTLRIPAPTPISSPRTPQPPPSPLPPGTPSLAPPWLELQRRFGGGARTPRAPIGAGTRPAGPERAPSRGWLDYKSRALAPRVRLLSGGAA